MANALTEFKEREILPRLLQSGYITTALPCYSFRDKGNRWVTPFHVNGEKSSDTDQSYIYKNGSSLHDQNGDKLSIVDLYMRESGQDYPTALRSLADICGVGHLFPEYDSEEARAYKETQDKREEANARFVSALWSGTPEANRVLDYIRSRNWTDEEIRRASLGYADEELIKLLPYFDTHDRETGKDAPFMGSSHRLTIPYRGGSSIYGFKFRDIDHASNKAQAETEGREYKIPKYWNTTGLSKNADFFGIPVSVSDITIVEGELDALHARVKGADYVVATTGGRATDSQIDAALKRGVKRFTLLYDNDESGRKFIKPTIEAIEKRGAEVYIAYLPEDVKDADEYLATHSLEDWDSITGAAIPSYKYSYYEIYDKYVALGDLNDKQREDFFTEVETLLNSAPMIARPHNREYLYDIIKDTEEGLRFKVDDFRAFADRKYIREQAKQRRQEVLTASSTIATLTQEGKIDEALKLMRETASTQGAQDRATEYSKIFAPVRSSELDSYLSEIPEGIPTGITFKEGRNEEKLSLNSGLTFICGYRGHGKTSFLNNIALNEVRRNIALQTGKSVLYFSYEVDKRRLITDLLNTYVNDPELQRTKTPIDAIHSYFKGHGGRFFSSQTRADGRSHYDHFLARKEEFSRDYLESGNLIIVDENYKVGQLLEAIRYYLSIYTPSIVCIDYAQLIYSEDYSRQRTEEIKKVVNDIKDFANKEGIPFVLAAQFNREVYSPVSVDTRNIGEGGDFERIADTCIGLFNLKELKPLGGTKTSKDEETEAKKLLSRLTGENITELSPRPNKLFVRLMKRRYGYYPLDTLLEWEGRTKKITLNDEAELLKRPEDDTPEPQQTELFTPPKQDEILPF